ncbi:MAG: transposase [Actinomycetales bacterium]|nr:transposase [Actinomycetales bacterium]MBP8880915.1 transposase [Dermatophilaceae bacterium]
MKDRPLVQVKDLDACGQVMQLWWRKRRLATPNRGGGRLVHPAVRGDPGTGAAHHSIADRVGREIAAGNRAVDEVARAHRVSWPTAHRALVAAAARWLPRADPGAVDETRATSVRWVLADAGWRRTEPWLMSFVDADTTGPGRMLGLAPGRSGACVRDWLAEQTPTFRAAIEVVVIDTCAPYASGIRTALPRADRDRQVAPGGLGQPGRLRPTCARFRRAYRHWSAAVPSRSGPFSWESVEMHQLARLCLGQPTSRPGFPHQCAIPQLRSLERTMRRHHQQDFAHHIIETLGRGSDC